MEGGKKLGEGKQGIAYDLCEGESLCSMLETMKVNKITVFTLDGESEVDPKEYLKKIKKQKNMVVKVFKQKGFLSKKTIEKEFFDEMESNVRVAKILNKTTVCSKKELGIYVEGSRSFYAIVGIKCDNEYEMTNPKKFVKDILEMLEPLNESLYHNDIKHDNVVKCGTKFTLIDWGGVSDIDTIDVKSTITTSPIKLYLSNFSYIVSKNIFIYKLSSSIKSNPHFKEHYKRIMKEFEEESAQSKKVLLQKFHKTHDVFQLGMTLLILCIMNDLEVSKYKDLIETLTSLKNPLTPKEAMSAI
jgi:thiamine kinase-like enzyme